MIQRARFLCPLGGEPLLVFYDDVKLRFHVEPQAHRSYSPLSVLWHDRLGDYRDTRIRFTLDDVRALLSLNGVDGAGLDFEGV